MGYESSQRLGRGNARLATNVAHVLTLLAYAGGAVFLIVASWPATSTRTLIAFPSLEAQYLVLVGAGAALGTTLVALSALLDTQGRRARAGVLGETLRPLIAAVLGTASYVVVRGALLRPDTQSVGCLNPYGVVGAALVLGIFTGPVLAQLTAVTRVLSGQESQLNEQIDRMATVLGVTTLDNYTGFLCAAARDATTGKDVRITDGRGQLAPNTQYDFVVWFQRDHPGMTGFMVTTEIQVTGGADTDTVEFSIGPQSDNVQLRPRAQTLTFAPEATSSEAAFRFRSPESAGAFEVWVEVTQKNRLIHSLESTFVVTGQPS